MRSSRIALFVVALLMMLASVGCGTPYTISSPAKSYPPQRGLLIQMEPLLFTAGANMDDGKEREDDKTWRDHINAWNEKYQVELLAHAKKRGLRVQPGVTPNSGGVVLKAMVVNIDKNGSSYMGRNYVSADVSLVDATGAIIWTSRIEAASRGSGPQGYTFGGRIGWSCETLARALVDLLAGEPEEDALKPH